MAKKQRFRYAVGLQYDQKSEDAPIVGVKGELVQADEIVKLAKRFGIPVVEREEVAQMLFETELDEEINPDLYEAVAIILNELQKVERK